MDIYFRLRGCNAGSVLLNYDEIIFIVHMIVIWLRTTLKKTLYYTFFIYNKIFFVFFFNSQVRNRIFILCPVCKKAQSSLPLHLRMACTKHSPNDDMEFAVDAAKQEANRLLRRGRVWKYSLVQRIMDKPDPVARYNVKLFTLFVLKYQHFTSNDVNIIILFCCEG